MADFAIVSLDSLLFSAKGDPEWTKRDPFVARLAPETVEVIAPREVKSIGDLQGKTVSFGDLDSATSTSGRMLFSRLGVTPNQTNEPLPEALDALAAGKRDAVVVLGAEGSRGARRIWRRRALSHRLHSLVGGFGAGLRSGARDCERPAQSRPRDRTRRNGRRADGARRARRAGGIRRARMRSAGSRGVFFDNYDSFLSDDRDAHWRDVNLAADASWPFEPWPRLAAAQGWLDAKKTSADASLDAFRASAKSAADFGRRPSAADSDRLYDGLTRWRGLMQ